MSTSFSTYRDAISRSSLTHWPELSWLSRFLQTPKPASGDETSAKIFDLVDDRLLESNDVDTAASLSQALESQVPDSRLRLVLVGHGDSWDVDRDMLDVVCNKYDVDPRFLAKHLDYPTIRCEKHCPSHLRHAVQSADDDFLLNGYSWDLGGEIMSHLSLQLGSCFFFAYASECLSLMVLQEDLRVTLLLFVRAPQSELVATSRVFFHYPYVGNTALSFLNTQPPKSLYELLIRSLPELALPKKKQQGYAIAKVVATYFNNLAECCKADYRRNIAPRALKSIDILRTEPDTLLDVTRQFVTLRQEVEAFNDKFHAYTCNMGRGKETCSLLSQLTEESQRLLSFWHNQDRSSESEDLRRLIQAQVDETKQAKKTSAELGRLSQLAYIFLPLQLTTSAMGMNLKDFGTGTIEMRTFLLMFGAIAALSLVPLLYPLISKLINDRIPQMIAMMKYSRRAGFLFGLFCLFHRRETNDSLLQCGIKWDLDSFEGRQGKRPGDNFYVTDQRDKLSTSLKKQWLVGFPRFWQKVCDEIFNIIDAPRWGGKDTGLHTA